MQKNVLDVIILGGRIRGNRVMIVMTKVKQGKGEGMFLLDIMLLSSYSKVTEIIYVC